MLNMLETVTCNTAVFMSFFFKSLSLQRARWDVHGTQLRLLRSILGKNCSTRFGREHHFSRVRSHADYCTAVPLSLYEDYHHYIELIAAGEKNVLTAEDIELFEPTSGSASPSKFIPYCCSLRKQFQKAIAAWIANMYLCRRGLFMGKAYWQITPSCKREKKGIIPVGFDNDSSYLGDFERPLMERLMAVPPEVSSIADSSSFLYVTLLFLLRDQRLSFISIWNPTFLTLLLDRIPAWSVELLSDIEKGTITPPSPMEDSLLRALQNKLDPSPVRARFLKALIAQAPLQFDRIWPCLALISCWADGHAGPYARGLERLFPGAAMQPKGLLATEAVVSFPLSGRVGHALAIESHFFEFIEYDLLHSCTGAYPRCAHELEEGRYYIVVVTTGGGLYRYRLNDIVQVTGHWGNLPLLRFVGRSDGVSDYRGEKLHPVFAVKLIEEILHRYDLEPSFMMAAPELQGEQLSYTLFMEIDSSLPIETKLHEVEESFEQGLCSNYHYLYCRQLGQLGRARLYMINPAECSGRDEYLKRCGGEGTRLGAIKPALFHRETGWSSWFRGSFL